MGGPFIHWIIILQAWRLSGLVSLFKAANKMQLSDWLKFKFWNCEFIWIIFLQAWRLNCWVSLWARRDRTWRRRKTAWYAASRTARRNSLSWKMKSSGGCMTSCLEDWLHLHKVWFTYSSHLTHVRKNLIKLRWGACHLHLFCFYFCFKIKQ